MWIFKAALTYHRAGCRCRNFVLCDETMISVGGAPLPQFGGYNFALIQILYQKLYEFHILHIQGQIDEREYSQHITVPLSQSE